MYKRIKMDKFGELDRSYIMSLIRSKNTKPEELVRKWLFSKGFRYRKNVKKLPGCPDIVLPKYRTVIFINGCFWHMHINCPSNHIPKTNREFWEKKLSRNQLRDSENLFELEKLGWNVIVVWECGLTKKRKDGTLEALEKDIVSNRDHKSILSLPSHSTTSRPLSQP